MFYLNNNYYIIISVKVKFNKNMRSLGLDCRSYATEWVEGRHVRPKHKDKRYKLTYTISERTSM